MNDKILIIKLGASGDLIRTTPLLRVLIDDEITWITHPKNMELLPADSFNFKEVLSIDEADYLKKKSFDLVISLDDEIEVAQLASSIKAKELVGIYMGRDGRPTYTDSAAPWFDMGLISKFGKAKADSLKIANTRTYQEILFSMLGLTFRGEEYFIRIPSGINCNQKHAAIEQRAGNRWPTKRWNRYLELASRLETDGYKVWFLEQRPTMQQFIRDIGRCNTLITGDTLAMHIALALKIRRVVALFTCTSPTEIYDYGRMKKIVSPYLNQAFYLTDYVAKAVEAISLEQVYKAVTE